MAKRKRNKQTKRQKVKKRLKMELAEVKTRKYKTTFKDIKKFLILLINTSLMVNYLRLMILSWYINQEIT